MTYKGYQARVELDEEAGVFHGEVINTRDVITFQGSSVEKLKQAFEDSVDDYVEFCASRGEDPEKPVSTAEKLSALRTEDYFRERAQCGDAGKVKRTLKRAGRGNSPVPGDEIE